MRIRTPFVGVDAHIDPAVRNHKIARTIGGIAPHPCRGGRPCPPVGICGFAAAYRKNGRASYGSMWASTPTNTWRGRRLVVRFCNCAGRGKPLPYGNCDRLYGFALVRPDLQMPTAQSLRHGFAVPPPFTQGRLWRGGKPPNGIAVRGHFLSLADNLNPGGRSNAVRTCRDHSERRLAVADAARRLDLHGGADAFAHERHVVLRRAAA